MGRRISGSTRRTHNFSTSSLGSGTYVITIRTPEGQLFEGGFVRDKDAAGAGKR
jgi:hypothetical protein